MLKASELTVRLSEADLLDALSTHANDLDEVGLKLSAGALHVHMKVGGGKLPMPVPVDLTFRMAAFEGTTVQLAVEWTNMGLVPGFLKEKALSKAFAALPGRYEQGRFVLNVAELLQDRPISFRFGSLDITQDGVRVTLLDLIVLESVDLAQVEVLPPLQVGVEPARERVELPEHQSHYDKLRAKMAKVVADRVPAWAQPLAPWVLAVPDFFVTVVRLARSPEVPSAAKGMAAVAVAYFLTPVDLIPDIIPFMGQMDDVAVALFTIDHIATRVPRHVMQAAWPGDADVFQIVGSGLDRFGKLLPAKLLARVKQVVRKR